MGNKIIDVNMLAIPGEALNYIKIGGSKAGLHSFLTQSDLAKEFLEDYPNILPEHTHILHPGDKDIDKFLEKIHFNGTPYIVRGWHPEDFTGAVDVFDTKIDTVGIFDAKTAKSHIMFILEQAKSDLVKSFMQYETGMPFNGEAGIMLQEYYGPQGGSIIEHPFDPGVYIIEKMAFGGRDRDKLIDMYNNTQEFISLGYDNNDSKQLVKGSKLAITQHIHNNLVSYTYDSNKRTIDNEPVGTTGFTTDLQGIVEMVRMYKRFKDTCFIPKDYSVKLDFGIPVETNIFMDSFIKLYQATLFRKHETKAERGKDMNLYSEPYRAVGITPEAGIELAIADIHAYKEYENQKSMAYFCKSNVLDHHPSTPLSVQPANINVFLGSTGSNSMLGHGYFRRIKKAPISAVGPIVNNATKKIRIYANGIQARWETVR